jgi:hypothetical protein
LVGGVLSVSAIDLENIGITKFNQTSSTTRDWTHFFSPSEVLIASNAVRVAGRHPVD